MVSRLPSQAEYQSARQLAPILIEIWYGYRESLSYWLPAHGVFVVTPSKQNRKARRTKDMLAPWQDNRAFVFRGCVVPVEADDTSDVLILMRDGWWRLPAVVRGLLGVQCSS